jgi:hypothetical protein
MSFSCVFSSLAEVTEHLFPSAQATSSTPVISNASWKTSKDNTIFGRMCGFACYFHTGIGSLLCRYRLLPKPVQEPSNGNEFVL